LSTTFADLGVPAAVARRLADAGITEPFPIQAATLPDGLAGRDLCGRAPTGSGKTLAFGIPLVERLARAPKPRARRPRGLVLVPTRELANQVRDQIVDLAGDARPSVVTLFGGVGFEPQLRALRRGVDLAVACPGRLADLVSRGDVILDDVEIVVLDEADRMADMGFLPEVRRLLDTVRADRQTLLFSATLDGDVDVLVRRYQKNPVRHELDVAEDEPVNRHVFWRIPRPDRVELTAEVATRHWPTVVFCRTKRGADRLAQKLGKLGVSAAAIHGDRSQRQREAALASFASGKVQALVATDVAARGIHVDDVACVLHFDPPADEKDYVHRSGRTGRAGRVGLVVSLIGGDQMADAKKMQRTLGMEPGIVEPDVAGLGDPAPPAPRPAPKRNQTVADIAAPSSRRSGGGAGHRKGNRPVADGDGAGANGNASGPSPSGSRRRPRRGGAPASERPRTESAPGSSRRNPRGAAPAAPAGRRGPATTSGRGSSGGGRSGGAAGGSRRGR
jgi:superfamily II DNA/RNA helicase